MDQATEALSTREDRSNPGSLSENEDSKSEDKKRKPEDDGKPLTEDALDDSTALEDPLAIDDLKDLDGDLDGLETLSDQTEPLDAEEVDGNSRPGGRGETGPNGERTDENEKDRRNRPVDESEPECD